jgi:hypothetical protein
MAGVIVIGGSYDCLSDNYSTLQRGPGVNLSASRRYPPPSWSLSGLENLRTYYVRLARGSIVDQEWQVWHGRGL